MTPLFQTPFSRFLLWVFPLARRGLWAVLAASTFFRRAGADRQLEALPPPLRCRVLPVFGDSVPSAPGDVRFSSRVCPSAVADKSFFSLSFIHFSESSWRRTSGHRSSLDREVHKEGAWRLFHPVGCYRRSRSVSSGSIKVSNLVRMNRTAAPSSRRRGFFTLPYLYFSFSGEREEIFDGEFVKGALLVQ